MRFQTSGLIKGFDPVDDGKILLFISSTILSLKEICFWGNNSSCCFLQGSLFSFTYALFWSLYFLHSYVVAWGLYPLPSLFVWRQSPFPCSVVGFLAAWFKSSLFLSSVFNSGILLGFWPFRVDVFMFWSCSASASCSCMLCNSGGFSLWVWVLYSMGYWLLTDYFVYFESLGSWARINVASFLFVLAFDHRSGILHYLLAEWFSLLFVKLFEITMV